MRAGLPLNDSSINGARESIPPIRDFPSRPIRQLPLEAIGDPGSLAIKYHLCGAIRSIPAIHRCSTHPHFRRVSLRKLEVAIGVCS